MKFSTFKTPTALAVALFAASAHAGFPDDAEGRINRQLAPGGNSNGNAEKSDDDNVRLIVVWKDEVGHQELNAFARDRIVDDISVNLHVSSLDTRRSNIEAIEKNPHIERVEEDTVVTALPLVRGAERESRQLSEDTNLYGIQQVQAHLLSQGTNKVKVCVVDTGYSNGHEDLPNLNTSLDGYTPSSYSGMNPAQSWYVDGHGHGSHCAGTIGAIGNNGKGVTSVNPDESKFEFFIGKGLSDEGWGYSSSVLLAVEACADAGAKVISMSLGGGGYSSTAEALYDELYNDRGVLIIAAAGNGGNTAMSYPASYKNVMSVAAVDISENKASFSQYNSQVEIAGPGVNIKSTIPTNSYATWSGTSMATPHVAGVAALVWSHFPQCTNKQIRIALDYTAKDKGNAGCDNNFGYGIVQAKDAYDFILDNNFCDGGDASVLAGKKGSTCEFPQDVTPPTTPPPPPPTTPPQCTDSVPGWHDSWGTQYTCDWYALDPSYCQWYGDGYRNFGCTANQACCTCGGTATCQDSYDGWYDADGPYFDCDWYASYPSYCAWYGDYYASPDFGDTTANEACCACNGGCGGSNNNPLQLANKSKKHEKHEPVPKPLLNQSINTGCPTAPKEASTCSHDCHCDGGKCLGSGECKYQ